MMTTMMREQQQQQQQKMYVKFTRSIGIVEIKKKKSVTGIVFHFFFLFTRIPVKPVLDFLYIYPRKKRIENLTTTITTTTTGHISINPSIDVTNLSG